MSDEQPSDERFTKLLGRRLREAREAAGLSLRELAQQVGLRDHTILIKYERGKTSPSCARVYAIANVLGISTASLLAERDETVALIGAIDQADELFLDQLQFILERLADAPPERPSE